MKKKMSALIILACFTAVNANAGWFSDKKDELKDKGKDELKAEVTTQLDKYCLKVPVVNYYICPPISPDWVDRI